MAPIFYHQVAADIAIDDHTSGGSTTVMMAETEEHQAGDQFAVDSNNFDDVGHTRDENDVGGVLSMGGAVAVIPRSGEMASNAFTQQARSSFFMDECSNNYHLEENVATTDLKSLALMTSFDFDALEDIDLMTSPPSNEQLQEEPQQYTTTAREIAIISADEELARQLQAEEDESARLHREAIIFRKSQKARSTRQYKPPRKKLKKSWLDRLIGEPFPQEMRRNYATRSDSQQNSTRSSGHVTLPTPSYYDCPTCTSMSHFSNLLLHDSCRYSHDKHKTQIPLWCLAAN
ncbi:hypothetical protein QTG54_013401 [Skeletonema marinoi]|uniref:Uncharacterized protein n=1 Tax=Skeletonema marinoi TaxID=267567 RepID=A0AAD8XYH4_9STRA|nr:hypothetical protein QTG54_013401 [Skeletonema marinoi]